MERFGLGEPLRRNLVSFGVLVFVNVVMLILSTRSMTGIPEQIGLSIFSFFQGIISGTGDFASDTFNSIAELGELKGRYQEVLSKLETYDTLERDMSDIRLENGRLKEQLGIVPPPAYGKITAQIIGKDPEGLYSTFIVNKGTRDGVKKDQAVIALQGGTQGMVGKVLSASGSTSIIVPLYDATMFISARFQRVRYEGLLNGSGSTDFPLEMKYVRKRAKEDVQFGDIIVTSGLQSIYPKDIIIGRVTKLIQNDFETSVRFEIEPEIDFSRLEYVIIVYPEYSSYPGEALQ